MHPGAQIAEIADGADASVSGAKLQLRPGLGVEDSPEVEAEGAAAGPVLSRQAAHQSRRVRRRQRTIHRLRNAAKLRRMAMYKVTNNGIPVQQKDLSFAFYEIQYTSFVTKNTTN